MNSSLSAYIFCLVCSILLMSVSFDMVNFALKDIRRNKRTGFKRETKAECYMSLASAILLVMASTVMFFILAYILSDAVY